MSDEQLVYDSGIRSAVIVDDGYDEVPQVSELLDEGAWDSMFDDAQGDAAEPIKALFPDYDELNREELKSDQKFINALWQNRETIRDLLGGLFDDYELKIQDNRRFLDAAEAALTALQIPFKTYGRDFIDAAVETDLIVIDLFLGIQQGHEDREVTVERLKTVIELRKERPPPSIVLMSQVPEIIELAKKFRHDVKLHASAFRHIRKNDLPKPGRMNGLILTLALHRSDSQALATFVETWQAKTTEAVREAVSKLRKIDIDDLQHIRSMLLRFEGVNTSSYILDVFDRVLQYEIESYSTVLEAAAQLDVMADTPAPLMISNDRDTYKILEQTLFVNPKRRAHATGAEWPIAFGDILGPKLGSPVKPRGFFSGRDDLVFFVASPECDLIRKDGLTTALLVAGSLSKIDIDMSKPGLAVTEKTTPVITLNGSQRFQINWDFGDLRSIKLDQAKRLLHQNSGYMSIIARLRAEPALSLKQQLLSNVGRVAELPPLPRSLRFGVELMLRLQSGGTQTITIPDGVKISGNLLIPRNGRYATAIIDSDCEHELTEILLSLDIENVANKSKNSFETLKEQSRIRQIFRSGFQGIDLPLRANEPRRAGLIKLDDEQPISDNNKPKTDQIATIIKVDSTEDTCPDFAANAGLILQIHMEDD